MIELPSPAVLRGLRIIQAQVNPYHPSSRYVVDLPELQQDDPDFLEDLRAAWDWISLICWTCRDRVEKNQTRSDTMRQLWKDPNFRERVKEAAKRRTGKPVRRFTDNEIQHMLELRRSGWKLHEIAEELQCNVSTVGVYCRNYGAAPLGRRAKGKSGDEARRS